MFKDWKELGRLHCVKELGFRHRIAHLLGTNKVSWCFHYQNMRIAEGFRKGLANDPTLFKKAHLGTFVKHTNEEVRCEMKKNGRVVYCRAYLAGDYTHCKKHCKG